MASECPVCSKYLLRYTLVTVSSIIAEYREAGYYLYGENNEESATGFSRNLAFGVFKPVTVGLSYHLVETTRVSEMKSK